MTLKRIDRYVAVGFLSRFVFCLGVVAALYIGFDLLKRLDEFQDAEAANLVVLVVRYYSHVLPLFLLDIVPAATLIAAGMVLVRMSSNHELLALKASGISTYRIVGPIMVSTLIISGLVLAARETVVPPLVREQSGLRQTVEGDRRRRVSVEEPGGDRLVYFGVLRYRSVIPDMKDVTVFEFYPRPEPTRRREIKRWIFAEKARLEDGNLVLEPVTDLKNYGAGGSPGHTEGSPPETIVLETEITTEQIARAAEEGEQMVGRSGTRLTQLAQLMRAHPHIPTYSVAFHFRISSFFTPFILLLVGIPCLIGFEESIQSRFVGVLISIAVSAGFYTLLFVFNSIGESGTVPPVLAGWLPVVVIGSLGLYLFESRLS